MKADEKIKYTIGELVVRVALLEEEVESLKASFPSESGETEDSAQASAVGGPKRPS